MYGEKQSQRPQGGQFYGYDHIHFWVGNAFQSAGWYATRFGFEYYAYKGLETGDRDVCTHVMRNNEGVLFAFSSPYTFEKNDDMHKHQARHGDAVKDVAFSVEDATALYNKAVSRGALSVLAPQELKDEHGIVILASVQTYGDVIHTFVQRGDYKGFFLPGFKPHPKSEPLNKILPHVHFVKVDHVVGNQGEGDLQATADWYEKHLDFHRFFCVDDTLLHTEYSSLNSIVMSDFDLKCRIPLNEPARGRKVSQIQEFVNYHNGPGAQHVAFNTKNIIQEVEALTTRGVDFVYIPDAYYDNFRKNIPYMNIKIDEDIDLLQKHKILIDYDDKGYLLQIFTKPVQDRPTFFTEVIQRNNHEGIGYANFKALFTAVEQEQAKRGNLLDNPSYEYGLKKMI